MSRFKLSRVDRSTFVLVVLFVIFSLGWGYLQLFHKTNQSLLYLYSDTYFIVALWGAIGGFISSWRWGGFSTKVGRSIAYFSVGLLFQVLGQLVYAYYMECLGIDVPYPSVGDIGFFGSIPFYILGTMSLIHAFGCQFHPDGEKLLSLFFPIGIFILSSWYFLQGKGIQLENLPKTFLDFGYPLGQAVYVSLAISAYFSSKIILEGVIRVNVLTILLGLLFQYLADSMFLYQAKMGTWHGGSLNDYLYMCAYFLIGLGIIGLRRAYYCRTIYNPAPL
jgi:hypothetical protein